MVGVRLVGRFGVSRDGVPIDRSDLGSRKGRELLKLLAVERDRVVTVDRIVEVLWPDSAPAHPPASVATLVSRLRKALGPELVDGDREGYRLGAAPGVTVDLDEAARWVAEAERRHTAGEPALAVAAAARADELLGAGDVLVEEPSADWAEPARIESADLLRRCRRVMAEAALATGDHVSAVTAATTAVAADPYDEPARRVLMRAHVAAGEPARALTTYAELSKLLADELGTDPAAPTRDLHLAILRDQASPAVEPSSAGAQTTTTASETIGLVGRAAELRALRTAWNAAAGGRAGLVLVVGEAGIGKTRLVEELERIAESTGGTVMMARCYSTESSLFLQPLVEAVGPVVHALPAGRLVELAGEHASALAQLLPGSAAVLGPVPIRRDNAGLERRRAFEGLTSLLRGLSERTPVLLSLDDVQNAGRSSLELLHYLARHAPNARILVAATVREEEGADVLDTLAGVADFLSLGPLPPDAVRSLATAAGLADQTDDIMTRTQGHSLYVVETLRALGQGNTGIPESLEAAVLTRVRRAGPDVEALLRAGAVLGVAFEPRTVAGLLAQPLPAVVSTCSDALAARLLVVAGRDYEFANDLVRDVLYATTPEPTRVTYHRVAADLLTMRPEAVAIHAAAAQEWVRASRAWLLAGENALARAAADDAIKLLGSAIDTANLTSDVEIRARALILRSRAHAARADYPAAMVDIEAAARDAREIGDQRLEVVALRALGGEVPTALGRPVADCVGHLERGLVLAAALSDHAMEADLQAWLAVLAVNGLRFADAVDHGHLAVIAARASGDEESLAAALDGQKTSLAYLGEIDALREVVEELEPLLRRRGDLFLLHWAIFESAFIHVAGGDWPAAASRIETALEVNRRSGFSAYAAWHLAHLGWLARMTGDYDRALDLGRRALEHSADAPHRWCVAVAGALLGTTLLEIGDVDAAVDVLETARVDAQQQGAESYLLRVMSPLAEATGSREDLLTADALLSGIRAPAGSAFLAGDACYLAVARAWLAHDEPERSRRVLAPMLAAAGRVPWVSALAEGSLVDGLAARQLGERAESEALLRRAAELGQRYGLRRVAVEAAAAVEA